VGAREEVHERVWNALKPFLPGGSPE
jgi:hypothetical protein